MKAPLVFVGTFFGLRRVVRARWARSVERIGLIAIALCVCSARVHAGTQTTFQSGTALDAADGYSGGSLPTASSDVIFATGYPTGTASFSLSGSDVNMGSLNDLNTHSITIDAPSGTSVLTLGNSTTANSDTVTGSNSADLIYLGGTTSSLNLSGPGTLGLALAQSGNFDVANSGATLTISSAISGSVSLTKTGAGKLVLGGSNSFGGVANTFTISAGTVQMSSGATMGSTSNGLAVNGTLDLNGTAQSVDALTGSGSVTNTSSTGATLTVGSNNGSGTYSGTLSATSPNTVALTKVGTGTETITGSLATATVSGGTLQVGVSGTGSITGQLFVNGSGAVVAGTGVINNFGSVTNGMISPGDSGGTGAGTLTFSEGLQIVPTTAMTTVAFNIHSAASADQLVANQGDGDPGLTLNGNANMVVTFDSGFVPANLDSWTLISAEGGITTDGFNIGSSFRSGNNADGNEGNLDLPDLTGTGLEWFVSFGGGGQTHTLDIEIVVPEPSRAVLLMVGLGVMMLRRRRR